MFDPKVTDRLECLEYEDDGDGLRIRDHGEVCAQAEDEDFLSKGYDGCGMWTGQICGGGDWRWRAYSSSCPFCGSRTQVMMFSD